MQLLKPLPMQLLMPPLLLLSMQPPLLLALLLPLPAELPDLLFVELFVELLLLPFGILVQSM
jgi:hypothetical protein